MAAKTRRSIAAADKARGFPPRPITTTDPGPQPSAPAPVEAAPKPEAEVQKSSDQDDVRAFVPITKASDEEQTVTGVVLQPEVVDGQGDIYDSTVIRKAAHNFLAGYNSSTQMGLQHKDFKKRFELVESFLAPMDMAIGSKVVKSGSWIIVVKVLDKTIWKQVKDGKLTGFSIGGKAKAQKLEQTNDQA